MTIQRPGQGITHEDIDERFSFHPTAGRPDVGARHDYVRWLFRQLAHELVDQLPAGRDQSLAITHLEDGMMRSNRALALYFSTTPAVPAPLRSQPIAKDAPAQPRPIPRPPSAYAAGRPRGKSPAPAVEAPGEPEGRS